MLCQLKDPAGIGGFNQQQIPAEVAWGHTFWYAGNQMTEIILPVIRLQASNKIMVIKCICNEVYTFEEKKYFLITGK